MLTKFFWVVVAVGLVSYGLVASRETAPGSLLYPAKLLGDQIEYRLMPAEADKVKLKLDWLGQKSIDIKKDTLANDSAQTKIDTRNFQDLADQIKTDIKRLQDSGKNVTDLNNTLKAILATNACTVNQ